MHRDDVTRPDSTQRGNDRLVLLVDADEHERFICRSMLSRHGYEVVTATDGEIGIQLCDASPPGSIIIDIDPPTCASLDVVQVLAQHPRFRGPTIAMTRRAMIREQRALGTLRLRAILVKPVDPKTLVTAVRGMFGTTD